MKKAGNRFNTKGSQHLTSNVPQVLRVWSESVKASQQTRVYLYTVSGVGLERGILEGDGLECLEREMVAGMMELEVMEG